MTRIAGAMASVSIGLLIAAGAASICAAQPPPGECPQPRFTGQAPDDYFRLKNPLQASDKVLKSAERLYLGDKKHFGCAACHGKKGDGKGELAEQFVPRPRNFACARTVNEIPDGQLFWIVKFGSPGTAMPAHDELADEQIWQLVHYLRKLAK